MPAERFFLVHSLQKNESIIIKDEEYHHLVRVMRNKVGDQVEIINGNGVLAIAEIVAIEKKQASLIIKDRFVSVPPKLKITLLQSIPKPNRLDNIVEKCTELGVTDICLIATQKSDRKELSEDQLKRLAYLSIAAAKQSGRLFLPRITIHNQSLDFPKSTCFYGDVDPSAPLLVDFIQKNQLSSNIVVAIGPESGFTDEELRKFKSKGFQGIHLNKAILRTDTAAITAIALISHLTKI